MAGASDAVSESGGEEGDYETDSDGTSTLALRRRAASDDEEDETGHRRGPRVGDGAGGHLTQDAASSVDGESSRLPYSDDEDDDVDDGEGAPPPYEEDEEEELLLEEDDHQTDGPSRQLLTRRRKGSDAEEDEDDVGRGAHGDDGSGGSKRGESPETAEGSARPGGKEVTEDEKKEAEPFVVPTAGAFYMHDDRFRDNGGARPRRGMGGRKLWEAKDEKPWVHDLFEEFNNLGHDQFADQGYPRGGRGRGRVRGRGRGRGRGVGRVNNNDDVGGMRARAYGRGRGSRRDAAESARDTPSAANYAAKVLNEAEAIVGTDQSRSAQSIQQEENAGVKKATSGSYLNSASPPFIPSGVLQQKLAGRVDGPGETDGSAGQIPSKGRDQYGGRASFSRANFETAGVSKLAAGSGRDTVSGGQNSGRVWSQGDSVLPAAIAQQAARSASASVNQQQKLNLHNGSSPGIDSPVQQSGRGTAPQAQTASFVRSPQTQGQTQQSQQGRPVTSNSRSLPQPSSGSAGTNSVVGSNNPRYKGNGGGRAARVGSMPVAGRGSFVFAGSPSAGLRVGDPGFQPPPAVGPAVAVQYGGQSPAGIGVPAVGMPLPNYPYGYPNSEVTWVPVLAGGGAIGANYGAPYMMEVAASHMYYTQATAQPATAYHLPGRDINGTKHQPPGGLWKPPPSPELGTDEFGQRQSKPRRYSEMNFGQ